jgi:Zn-dependent M28 family amino/carboxypeptidase
MRALAWAVGLLAVGTALAATVRLGPDERRAAQSLRAEELRGHIRFLASDLLEGRGPGTRGDQLAQAYIAAQFELLGLEPAGPNRSYLQPFELVGIDGQPEQLEAKGPKGERLSLSSGEEVIVTAGAQAGTSKVADAELVFVGYGIQAKEYDWDDFKGQDVRGKVLLVMNNDPDEDPALFAGKTRLWYGRWDYKYLKAAELGAAGAIIIHTRESAGYPWAVVRNSWTGEQFELPQGDEPRLQIRGWATEDSARKLVALGGKDLEALRRSAKGREFRPVPLGVKVSAAFTNKVQATRSANVLGLLRGSDPKRNDELVVFTAHHDHLGRSSAAKPGEDAIYNGALDNASGVAMMLAVARAIRQMPKAPRRSILFAAVAAEEQGLLGSQHLAANPPVPPGKIAANINVDGINIWGRTADVVAIGFGKSTLDELVVGIAKAQGRKVKPDQFPDRGFFYRSDQFNFARIGVPAAYLKGGTEHLGRPAEWGRQKREEWESKNYHQPTDELSDGWDFSGALEDGALYVHLAVQAANQDALPAWRKGDEFEGIRLRALEAVSPTR